MSWASSVTVPVDELNITVDSAIYATMNDVLSPDMQDLEHAEYCRILISVAVSKRSNSTKAVQPNVIVTLRKDQEVTAISDPKTSACMPRC
jgi:hypothetical protein